MGVAQDYWFDMTEAGDTKRLDTYAWGGFLVDTREDTTGARTWTELIAEAVPAIQADVDRWGVL
jgi:hypothetical protein